MFFQNIEMRIFTYILICMFFVFPLDTLAKTADLHTLEQHMRQELALAGVNTTTAEGIVQAMVQAQFSENTVHDIIHQFRLAKDDQHALQAMAEKMHEGLAKHANAAAITRALSRVRARHVQAVSTARKLTVRNTMRLQPIIADALVSGLAERDLGEIAQHLQSCEQKIGKSESERLSMETMLTVRDMARYGLDSQAVTNVTTTALAHGYGAEDMHVLRQLINNQRMQTNMHFLGQRILQGVQEGVRAGDMQGYAQRGKVSGAHGKQGGLGGSSGGGGAGGHGGNGGHGGSGGHGGGR